MVKARHLCNRPTSTESCLEAVEATRSGLFSGHLCNQISSALVNDPASQGRVPNNVAP